jgi:hypothetical protein
VSRRGLTTFSTEMRDASSALLCVSAEKPRRETWGNGPSLCIKESNENAKMLNLLTYVGEAGEFPLAMNSSQS